MAEYMNKEVFLSFMGLTGDETKYGNRDAEHQHRSYSTYMSYEIMDCVDDSIVEEELVPVVRGRWIKPTKIGHRAFDIPHCSACDGVPCGVDENTNYCPNCGARMDGEGNG